MIFRTRVTAFAIIALLLKLSIADVNISRVNHIPASELPSGVSNTDWPFLYDTKLIFRYDHVNTISTNLFRTESSNEDHSKMIPFSIEFFTSDGRLEELSEYAITAVANSPTPISQMRRDLGAWQMIFEPQGAQLEGLQPIFVMNFVLISPQGAWYTATTSLRCRIQPGRTECSGGDHPDNNIIAGFKRVYEILK